MLGLMDQLTRIWLNDAAAASMRACLEQLTGGMVMRFTPDAASIMLLEVADAGATMRHSRAFTAEQDDVTFTPRALVHDGIEIDHEIPNDSSSDSEETMSAGFGRYYLTVMGATDLGATTRAAIDAARGKRAIMAPSALRQAAVARSRARDDSLFIFVSSSGIKSILDDSALSLQAIAAGLSFERGSASLTIELSR
jgi:hypothetical protein